MTDTTRCMYDNTPGRRYLVTTGEKSYILRLCHKHSEDLDTLLAHSTDLMNQEAEKKRKRVDKLERKFTPQTLDDLI